MQIVKKLFIGFLIVVELINLAIGGLLIFVGVKMYQQFSQVTDPTVQGLQYTGIVRPPGDTGLIVFGSLVVITAIVGLARVFVLTRYILLEHMVKAVILMFIVAGALVGLNLYLPQTVIFLQESYTTENAAFWSVFEPLLDCCGPATQCQGTQQQCDTAVMALIYAGQTYFNVVGGILLGIELFVLITTVYLLRTEQYEGGMGNDKDSAYALDDY